MTGILTRLAKLAFVVAGLAGASLALAVATAEVTVTGPSASSTTLRLFDAAGKPVAADTGRPNTYSNLPAGNYSAETLVDGKQVGTRSSVRLEDGDNQLRVNSATGAVEVIRRYARTQQQQQQGWGFGVMGGWKRTPYSGNLTSAALGASGDSGLETDGGSLALEARYNFRRTQQTLGAQLFAYGTFIEYFGTDLQRRFLDLHPTPGLDSGIRVDERRALALGLGGRWNVAQQVGLELMLGMHTTQARIAALSDESGGGGLDNQFSRTKYLVGPMIALGMTYPLYKLASGRPVLGLARYSAMRMPSTSVSGTSALGFDYNAHVDGGWQHGIQLGLQF